LLLVLGEFIHHFVEVHPKQAAQLLHDPIQCTFGSDIILYFHDVHQIRVLKCTCVVKVGKHHIPPPHELGLQACSHGYGEVEIRVL
jgi:hypothetical protein